MSDTTVCAPHALALLIEALNTPRGGKPDALMREGAPEGQKGTRQATTDPHGLAVVMPPVPTLEPLANVGEFDALWRTSSPKSGITLGHERAETSAPEHAMRSVQRFHEWPEGRAVLLDGVLASRDAGLGAALLAEPGAAAELARTPNFWERADAAFTAALLETAAEWFRTLWERRKALKPGIVCDNALAAVKSALDAHVRAPSAADSDSGEIDPLSVSIAPWEVAPGTRALRAAGRIALLAALDPARTDGRKDDACALRTLLTHPCANTWRGIKHEAAWFAAGSAVPAPLCTPERGTQPPAETGPRCMVIGQAVRAATQVTGQEAPAYLAHWQRLAAKQLRLAVQPGTDNDTGAAHIDDTSIRAAFLAAHTIAGAADAELVETLERMLETAHRGEVQLARKTVEAIVDFEEALRDDKASWTRLAKLTAACAKADALLRLGRLVGALNAGERLSVLIRLASSNDGSRTWRESLVGSLLTLCRDGDAETLDRENMALLRTGVVTVLKAVGLTHERITEDPDGENKKAAAACVLLCETLLSEYETTAQTKGEDTPSTLEWSLLQLSAIHAPQSVASARWMLNHAAHWGATDDERAVARTWAAACLATTATDAPDDRRARAKLEDIVKSQDGAWCLGAIRQYGDGNSLDVVATCAATAHAAGVPWDTIAVALDEKPSVGSRPIATRIAAGNCSATNVRRR